MTHCLSWHRPPMEDRVVLLNLLSLTWVAMVQASPPLEAHKEQVNNHATFRKSQLTRWWLCLFCTRGLVTCIISLQGWFLMVSLCPFKFLDNLLTSLLTTGLDSSERKLWRWRISRHNYTLRVPKFLLLFPLTSEEKRMKNLEENNARISRSCCCC